MTTSQYFGISFTFKWSNETYKQCSKPVIRNWNNAESKLLFQSSKDTKYSTDLRAPEFHGTDNSWYIIFTTDPNGDSPPPDVNMYCDWSCPAVHHRMYVLEGSDPGSWEATFTLKAHLNTYDQFAIDGAYFQHSTELYYVCSFLYRQYDGWPAYLYISKSRFDGNLHFSIFLILNTMSNPWTVSSNFSEQQIISVPSNPCEKIPYGRPFNVRLRQCVMTAICTHVQSSSRSKNGPFGPVSGSSHDSINKFMG